MKGKTLFCLATILAATVSFSISHAATKPQFDCTLTDKISSNDEPGDAKSTFTKTTPMIYLVCDSADVTKGQSIKAEWIAADTHNIAPANYKIDEKSLEVPATPSGDQTFKSDFSLSKPTNDWPAGSYHVDLFVDGNLIQSFKFSIG